MNATTDSIEELATQADTLLDANRIAEAQALYERITSIDPDYVDAWFMLGVIHGDTGNIDNGIRCLQKALKLDPEAVDAHFNLGHLLVKRGDIQTAIDQLRKAVTLDPEYPEAWMLLGTVYGQARRYPDAAQCFERTLALWPDSLEAQSNLANALLGSGQLSEAAAQLRALLDQQPQNVEALVALANTLQRMRQPEAAEECYRKLLAVDHRDIRGHNGLAEALISQGRFQEAETACRSALQLHTDNFQAHANLGTLLQIKGQLNAAREHLERAVSLAPNNAAVQYKLAGILLAQGEPARAEVHCRKAVELSPSFVEAQSSLASIYEHEGKYQQAWDILLPLINSGNRSPHVLTAFATLAHRYQQLPRAIDLLETMAASTQLPTTTRSQVYHQLGDLYERDKDHDKAFTYHQKSNQLKENRFDPAAHAERISRTIAVCDRRLLTASAGASNTSERPVFIVGMPRSGTSLVEQILASHPQVHGAGELGDIMQIASALGARIRPGACYPDCLSEAPPALLDESARRYLEKVGTLNPSALRVTDKMPHNYLHLGMIQMLFPRARVIHTARNPLDTCVSIYFQEFSGDHAYAYDLNYLAAYYHEYERLMQHWEQVIDLPILTVQYENLVADQENWSRRMIEFIGLEWDDRCLEFFCNKRHVATPSYDQVRQPMYTHSVERWRRYDRHLGPLKQAFGIDG